MKLIILRQPISARYDSPSWYITKKFLLMNITKTRTQDFSGKLMNRKTHMIHHSIQTAYQHKYDRNTTSSSKSITRFIWAPTGAFLMLLICWSLSVSFENLIGGEGVETPETKGFGGVAFGFCFAMLVSVDWHFSCCFLNLFKLSCSDAIFREGQPRNHEKNDQNWLIFPGKKNRLFCC